MARRKIRAEVLRKRLLQRRGIVQDKDAPLNRRFRPRPDAQPQYLKTTLMLLTEIEYNTSIEDILTSGPLIHNSGGTSIKGNCRRCVWCKYHIHPSTASKWRKRLGLPHYIEEAS